MRARGEQLRREAGGECGARAHLDERRHARGRDGARGDEAQLEVGLRMRRGVGVDEAAVVARDGRQRPALAQEPLQQSERVGLCRSGQPSEREREKAFFCFFELHFGHMAKVGVRHLGRD